MRISIMLEALTGRFDTDLQRSGRRADRELRRMQQSFRRSQRLVVGAIAAKTAAFAEFIRRTTNSTDELIKHGHQLDLTAEEMQRLTFIAGRLGTGVGSLGTAMQRATRRLSEARDGSGQAAQAISALGLDVERILAMNQAERFEAIAQALQGVSDQGRQAELAYRIFGRQGDDLLGIIRRNAQDLGALSATFDQFELSLSAIQAENIERLADTFNDVNTVTTLASQRFTADFAPAVELVIEKLFLAEARAGEFGETVDAASSRAVRDFAFVVNSVDGINRAFRISGAHVAIIFAQAQAAALRLADNIITGPIEALNLLIRTVNFLPSRITGIEIPVITWVPGVAEDVRRDMRLAEATVKAGLEDIQRLLLEPLAGDRLLEELESRARGSTEAIKDQLRRLDVPDIQLLPLVDPDDPRFREAERFVQRTRTEVEQLQGQIRRVQQLMAQGFFPEGAGEEVLERVQEQLDNAMQGSERWSSQMDELARSAARNMQTAFADFLFDPFEDGLDGMLESFARTLQRMVAEAASQQLLTALFSGLGGSSNPILSGLGSAFGGSRDSGGRGRPGQAYLIGSGAQPELFVPDSAGTFIPNARGGGGNVTINVIDSVGVSATADARQDAITGQWEIDMHIERKVSEMVSNGKFERSARSAGYDMRRRGAR